MDFGSAFKNVAGPIWGAVDADIVSNRGAGNRARTQKCGVPKERSRLTP